MRTRTFMAMMAIFAALALAVTDADARRLGGGRSMGTQRQSVAPPSASSTAPGAAANPVMPANPSTSLARPNTPVAPAAAPARSGMSRWLGPIAGIAAGLGLAALLSHFGLSEGFASFLMLALLAVGVIFIVRLLFARKSSAPMPYAAPANAPARSWADETATRRDERVEPVFGGSTGAGRAAVSVPAGFDKEAFLRQARVQFKSLQAAWDEGDLDTIADVTTPQMLEEVRRDLASRSGHEPTQVVRLDSELLEVTTEANQHWASVRFSGLVREDGADAPKLFDETWNLVKPVDGSSGWLLAGIQQNEPASVH